MACVRKGASQQFPKGRNARRICSSTVGLGLNHINWACYPAGEKVGRSNYEALRDCDFILLVASDDPSEDAAVIDDGDDGVRTLGDSNFHGVIP